LGILVLQLLAVGVAYYVSARLGLLLALVERNITPLWPPTGIALVAFLLLGRRVWPGIAVAAFLVNEPISSTPWAAAATAAGNTLAPLVAAELLKVADFHREIDRLRDAGSIVFLGALASMALSASIGTGTLLLTGAIAREEFLSAWAVWWTGDAMGVLVVAPFLLSLLQVRERRGSTWARRAEAVALFALLLLVSYVLTRSRISTLFMAVPLLGVIAWRFQQRGAAPAALVVAGLATWVAARGLGPFAEGSLFEKMVTLQTFNATVAFTSFVFAALVTERNRAREALERSGAELAATLQRSLLPDRLPEIPGVALAARYVPAMGGMRVGGDWYDVVALPNGHMGVAIGDVAGHGLKAAATMGQLRMALRAYALDDDSPAHVLSRFHRFAAKAYLSELATLVYLVVDLDAGAVAYANAGHPPPLLVGANGEGRFLRDGLAPPLGAAALPGDYVEASAPLPPGSTLVLFTDGLVERRRVPLEVGLDRLREAAGSETNLEALCDHLLRSFSEVDRTDDVALLALRLIPFAGRPLRLRVSADPLLLAPLRLTLRRWLREMGAGHEESFAVVTACTEACANAIQHPYGARKRVLEVTLARAGDDVEVTVADSGRWKPYSSAEGGRGLQMMQGLMDTVTVDRSMRGTRVRMRLKLRAAALR
jgi:integral membrane sensor domain MASE1/anti-sigma regulatory factor (Ser/Thr protein kinase)